MKKFIFALVSCTSLVSLSYPENILAQQLEEHIDEVIVTAELIQKSVLELPNSVTVLSQKEIEDRNAQHLEDLLNLAPNVNFSTGASRGRFIQIRGIGERSEFQEPIISSVGVVVDGIDLTGIATAATTLDTRQVEVLRGPQGTLFGANALAGLINIVSNRPSQEFDASFGARFEEFGGFGLDGVVTGPLSERTAYRLAVKQYESDGFTEDVFLERDDTNNIDETTARARISHEVNERLNLDFTLLYADIDNGFDAFSLDNTRVTFTDDPGFDRQKTTAGSIQANYFINDTLRFEGLVSAADSDIEYAFDEDWSNVGICDNTACDPGLLGFDLFFVSFDSYFRDNSNTSVDLKLVSQNESLSWVAGVYFRDQEISLDRIYTFLENDFSSQFDTTNLAAYGQAEFSISPRWALTSGLRVEQRETQYSDNNGASANPDETLWGGRLSLQYQADNGALYYGLVSRGYKAGGFNLNGDIDAADLEFDTETMINYELGIKQQWLDGRLQLQASVFLQDRQDIQTSQSIVRSIETGVIGDTCPCSFTGFTGNAASGTNIGLEMELDWVVSQRMSLFASLGLLNTEFDELLSFDHVNADRDNGVAFDLSGRDQAHAPNYQWVVGGNYALTPRLSLSGSIEAKDAFFFSERHDERSDAYELVNLELSYRAEKWSIAVYGKNLTNELVETRGFGSFGNDPREFYEIDEYNQFAAPRVLGVKAAFDF